jgi:hypothetical protein
MWRSAWHPGYLKPHLQLAQSGDNHATACATTPGRTAVTRAAGVQGTGFKLSNLQEGGSCSCGSFAGALCPLSPTAKPRWPTNTAQVQHAYHHSSTPR